MFKETSDLLPAVQPAIAPAEQAESLPAAQLAFDALTTVRPDFRQAASAAVLAEILRSARTVDPLTTGSDRFEQFYDALLAVTHNVLGQTWESAQAPAHEVLELLAAEYEGLSQHEEAFAAQYPGSGADECARTIVSGLSKLMDLSGKSAADVAGGMLNAIDDYREVRGSWRPIAILVHQRGIAA